MALVRAGFGIEDHDPAIGVTVGGKHLLGDGVDRDIGRRAEPLGRIAVIAGAGLADLQHELAVHCELEELAIRLAVTGEPDEVVVVDENTVLRLRPLIAGAWTAPRAHQVAGLVEHQHRRCRGAASGQGRILLGRALPLGQRTRALHDPDAIKPIDRDAGDLTEYPIVRQRLRPQGIDLELRNGCLGILRRRGARRRQYAGHGQQSISHAFHHFLPCISWDRGRPARLLPPLAREGRRRKAGGTPAVPGAPNS